MLAATFLACLAASAVGAAPVTQPRGPLASDQPLQVTNVAIVDYLKGNTTISFNVHDPEPLANTSATCSGAWMHGSNGYPQGPYVLCGNTTFAWNMNSFQSIQSFTLGLEHQFEDPSVGSPPYDHVTNFARAVVNSTNLQCVAKTRQTTCRQVKNTIIYAPIYATTAK